MVNALNGRGELVANIMQRIDDALDAGPLVFERTKAALERVELSLQPYECGHHPFDPVAPGFHLFGGLHERLQTVIEVVRLETRETLFEDVL